MLLVVTLAGSGLGWMGLRVREVRRQQVAVRALRKLDFNVAYDYECDLKGNYMRNDGPPGPRWLRDFWETISSEAFAVSLRLTRTSIVPIFRTPCWKTSKGSRSLRRWSSTMRPASPTLD